MLESEEDALTSYTSSFHRSKTSQEHCELSYDIINSFVFGHA